jgi:hypothetical protein
MPHRAIALLVAAISLPILAATAATAQVATAQRTFVASTGNDANPCSLTLPCRSFAAATLQTITGGEVIALDSAGYGTVTIMRAVSIVAPPGVYAGISVPAGQTGVLVNLPLTKVTLRGLTINAIGTGLYTYGIRMMLGASLNIEQCEIANFVGPWTIGVSIETPANVNVDGTTFRDSSTGMFVGYGAIANVTNSKFLNMDWSGIGVHGSLFTTNASAVYVTDSVFTGTGVTGDSACISNSPNLPETGSYLYATRVSVSNCHYAMRNSPIEVTAIMEVSDSMVTGNGYGFTNQGGTFKSLGNNHVSGNTIDTQGTITTIPPI